MADGLLTRGSKDRKQQKGTESGFREASKKGALRSGEVVVRESWIRGGAEGSKGENV